VKGRVRSGTRNLTSGMDVDWSVEATVGCWLGCSEEAGWIAVGID